MMDRLCEKENVRNIEYPFTEIFSLLKRYESFPSGLSTLVYKTDELKVINQHVENAMEIMLQGLQDIGHVMSHLVESQNELVEEFANIGFFISAVSNLTQALNSLRLDSDFVLEQRKKADKF